MLNKGGEAMMTTTAGNPGATSEVVGVPRESLGQLFWRFLRFGFSAWGGPVAQIAMIKQELVEEAGWITRDRFNRVLAVFQVLPGPEAHELCCYFGMLSRGRVGSVVAGLGFMLPGFVLMLLLSWLYVTYGVGTTILVGAFAAVQPAVAALIVRAVHRIGEHALHDRWLWAIAVVSALAQLAGVPFYYPLLAGAFSYPLFAGGRRVLGTLVLLLPLVAAVIIFSSQTGSQPVVPAPSAGAVRVPAEPLALFISGLKGGLFTFGGAYTAIPFLRKDAVEDGGWISEGQFLDSLALSGVLPAPLVIFATFIGFLAGGWTGGILMTAGMFLPAFAFTLVGHEHLERVVDNRKLHGLLSGVTAGVVGLIAATTLHILHSSVVSASAALVFALSLVVLYLWKSKLTIPAVVLAAAVYGHFLSRF